MELPNSEIRRALVASYAQVLDGLGLAHSENALVLPNSEFFPDRFAADEPSVQRLLDRLLEHAGLSEMALTVRVWLDADADAAACGTGACGSCAVSPAEAESVERLVDAGEVWQVNVLPAEVAQPVALSSALCRAVALAVLREAEAPPAHLDLDLAVDVTAVALGYGVLLLEGSHIYRKSCGGPSVARSTALGPSELALLLALSVALRGQAPAFDKYLSPTQRVAYAEAKVWADSNARLVAVLHRDPKRIARAEFELREPTSWLGRWLGQRAPRSPRDARTFDELEAALDLAARPTRVANRLGPQKF